MEKHILDFPKQFEQGLKSAQDVKIEGDFDNVIVSGMGGSAWPAEIIESWQPVNLRVNRNYQLPFCSPKTLTIFVSYSGNTEECLSAYKQALKKNVPAIAVTSGGKLEELCQENNTPCIKIPTGLVPRMATGHIFTALYSILKNSNLIPDKSQEILEMAKNLDPSKQKDQAAKLTKKLKNKIPLIYSSEKLKVLGFIWKIKINETAKSPAFANFFPELNHHEIEGMSHEKECDFSDKSIFQCLILKDDQDHPRVQKRMDLTASILNKTGLPTEIIDLAGQTKLEKIFSSILLADWTSYYLAKEYQTDPLKTDSIEEFKKQMKE